MTKSKFALFLDLSKAFDLVRHDLLLRKLEICGVRGIAYDIFKCYLSERKQYVVIETEESEMKEMKYGVPQGSCLGPLLFLIYFNDLKDLDLKGKLYLFADDSAIFYSSNDIKTNCDVAGTDLNHLNDYYISNELSLNYNKTKCIHF